tara:strand:+ start:11047 stop:11220 length:174 start_codon:yes stop_codon:yes gene_type:complete
MNENLLFDIVYEVLRNEEGKLALIDEGIFFSPELYLAFVLGKEIKINELVIFGEKVK